MKSKQNILYMKQILNVKSIIFLLIISLFVSCTSPYQIMSDNSKKNDLKRDNLSSLYKAKRYDDLKREAVNFLNKYPKNKKGMVFLSAALFKLNDFKNTEKITDKIFEIYPNLYDSLSVSSYLDIFYYEVYTKIEAGKFNEAKVLINDRIEQDKLEGDANAKIELLKIRASYKSENYDKVPYKIKSILAKYNFNLNIVLNLNFILAESYYHIGKISKSMEVLNQLAQKTSDKLLIKNIQSLLDRIVYTGDSDFFDKYNDQLISVYENLLTMTIDKSDKSHLLRSLNSLKNSTLSVKSILVKDDASYLSSLKMTAEKNETKIVFGSLDSIQYSYKFNGKILQIEMKNKKINSNQNYIMPLTASGITNLSWKMKNNDLILNIAFSDNYDMSFEEVVNSFEYKKGMDDKFQLILNVYLPDQIVKIEPKDKKWKYTIVIDPGHGGDDSGAVGIKRKANGARYTEKEVALMLAKKLKKYLEERNYRVFLTRKDDYYPSLLERNRIAQNRNADMFLSLHLNSASRRNKRYWQTDRYVGSEMVVRKTLGVQPKFINLKKVSKGKWLKKRKKALANHKKLSKIFQKTITQALDAPFNKKRTLKYKNLGIFSGMTIPHALIETGFIINNKNLDYLLSARGQNKLFQGIYNGIREYQKSEK